VQQSSPEHVRDHDDAHIAVGQLLQAQQGMHGSSVDKCTQPITIIKDYVLGDITPLKRSCYNATLMFLHKLLVHCGVVYLMQHADESPKFFALSCVAVIVACAWNVLE
jgi:hypothetical protein